MNPTMNVSFRFEGGETRTVTGVEWVSIQGARPMPGVINTRVVEDFDSSHLEIWVDQ